jgi:hypothetical protein
MRFRHFSPRTEEAYVHWIRRFILWSGKRHPQEMGATEVRAFLTDLVNGSGLNKCIFSFSDMHLFSPDPFPF